MLNVAIDGVRVIAWAEEYFRYMEHDYEPDEPVDYTADYRMLIERVTVIARFNTLINLFGHYDLPQDELKHRFLVAVRAARHLRQLHVGGLQYEKACDRLMRYICGDYAE